MAPSKLLGSGYIKFDLRDPTRMVVRKPRDPAMRAPAPKPTATAKPTTTKSDRAPTRDQV